MRSFYQQHILNEKQFNRKTLDILLDTARELEPLNKPGNGTILLQGQIITLLFYEPSTRTRLSFEVAAKILGAWTLAAEHAEIFSSSAKGETLEDTVRVVSGYSDLIVLRYFKNGSAKKAAVVSEVPIINGGDGPGSHPTQSLLDLYTIQKEFGKIDGISIAFVGDLSHYRAARSLSIVLTNYKNVKMYFVSPRDFGMNDDVKNLLRKKGIKFFETERIEDILRKVDVIYMTRTAKEYFDDREDYLKIKDTYTLRPSHLRKTKSHAKIMHPLPRVGEIDKKVDSNKKAVYFRQAKNGVAVRMALLSLILVK